ncbi:DUF2780 domain-containing protein [Tautonia marina]|uniref:DUF2780 domain-containing protein n=1 Tax=Tautonia marina TaxID=2653855 RepID=UPI001260C64F|nr:DUF2780 domain-containing protein [Tautonia marina]
MSDLFSALQSRTGLAPETLESGVGALLNFIKERLPAERFAQIESAIPQAEAAISAFLSSQSSPGMLEKVSGLVGSLLGDKAGDLPELFEMLSRSGLSIDQAKSFLPAAIEMLNERLPADLIDQILARLPGLGEALKQADA